MWYKAGTKDFEIKDYLRSVTVPKFISVYDQTTNLYEALCRIEKQNVGSKYVLAVDEVQHAL